MRHIGVDLSRNKFTACFLEADDSYSLTTFPMVPEGLEAFRAQLHGDDRLAVEAGQNTYFFHRQVQAAVAEVVLVATHKFAVIAQSKQKTDRNDAVVLARFLKLGCLPMVTMPEERIRELRNLFTARDTLVKMALPSDGREARGASPRTEESVHCAGNARQDGPTAQMRRARGADSKRRVQQSLRLCLPRRPCAPSTADWAWSRGPSYPGHGAPWTRTNRGRDRSTGTVHHSTWSELARAEAPSSGPRFWIDRCDRRAS